MRRRRKRHRFCNYDLLGFGTRWCGCRSLRNYLPKQPPVMVPVPEHIASAKASGQLQMTLDQPAQLLLIRNSDRIDGHQLVIAVSFEILIQVESISDAAGHPRREVATYFSEDDDRARSHIFAAVIADAFDNSRRAAVSYSETLARSPRRKQAAANRSIQHRVADDDVLRPNIGCFIRRTNDDFSAAHPLSDVVV